MNEAFLHHHAKTRAWELERQAAKQRLASLRSPLQRELGRIQRVYCTIIALFWFAAILPAAVSVLLAQARGLDLFQIGVFLGLYALTVVALEIPTGGLADAVGRKRVALLALLVTVASKIVFLFALSLPVFLLYAVLAGVGRALISGALEAWFVDSLLSADPKLELQPALAGAATVELLALGVGTLLSGLIPTLFVGLPEEGTAVLTPFSVTVLFSALLFALTFLAVLLLVREAPAAHGGDAPKGWRGMPRVALEAVRLSRRNPSLLLLLGASLAGGLALSGVETFWQPYFATLLGERGGSVIYGVLLAGSFGLGMLGNLLATPLARRFGGRYALVAAVFQGVQGLLLVLLMLQTATSAATAVFWLVFFSRGLVHSPHAALFNNEVPQARRATMLSVQSLAFYLGGFVGNVLLGFIAERSSIGLAWAVAGGVLLVSVGFYLRLDRRRARPPKTAAAPQPSLKPSSR